MPELPEVEIARRALARWTEGRRIAAVQVEDPAVLRTRLTSRPSEGRTDGVQWLGDTLTGARPAAPLRRGKRIGWRFDRERGGTGLLVHLGMTGKWVRRDPGAAPRGGRLALHLDDGATVWFVDPRRFGCLVAVPAAALAERLQEGLGPDALEEAPDGAVLAERLGGRRPIKVALLDQTALAGVGNIQASEVLWRVGIHPERIAAALSDEQWRRLAVELPAQLRRTIEAEGGEELRYLHESGADNPFSVYGRAGEPCPRCGAALARFQQAGRVSFCCPECQRA